MTELELFAAELATTAVSDGTYLLPGWDVKRVRAALAQPASVPAGWKLVPVEPTEEMLRAGCATEKPALFRESLRRPGDGLSTAALVESVIAIHAKSYAAMLAAAPQAPQPSQAVPQLTGCNCRWDGETQVQWCELHLAHKEAIHDWAGRAKAAEAKLAAPQPEAQPQWQPIKTAPRDGTYILVWTEASDTAYVVCWADANEGIRTYLTDISGVRYGWHLAWDGELFDGSHEPTHWMPLPAAPSAQAPQPEAQPQSIPLDIPELQDRLVAISSAVADQDDRAAQTMLGETLRMLDVTDAATIAGLESAGGHLSALVDEAQVLLTELREYARDLEKETLGGESERGEVSLLDRVDDWLDARPAAPSAQAEPTDTAGALMQQIREVCAATLKAGPGVAVPMPDAVRSEMQLFMRGEPNLIERLPFCDVVALSESEEVQALAAPSAQAVPRKPNYRAECWPESPHNKQAEQGGK